MQPLWVRLNSEQILHDHRWAAYTTHTQAQCELVSKSLMLEMSLTHLCMCIVDGIAWRGTMPNSIRQLTKSEATTSHIMRHTKAI